MEIIGLLHLQRIVGHYRLRLKIFLCIVLSQLVHTDKPTVNVKIANVSKQEHMKGRSVHLGLLNNKVNCIDIS